jgi:translation initiation factor IF-2
VDNEQLAREIISTRVIHRRQDEMTTVKKVTLEDLYKRIADGKIKQLNLIIKADVRGSVGALCDSIEKLNVKEIQLNIIRKDIGAINENDVNLAAASNALIIGLHIRPAMGAQFLAEKLGVDIRTYNIIYEVIDEIKKAMEGMLDPELKEVFLGRARVKEVFRTTKSRVILGCQVIEGKITNNAKTRILRENVIVAESRVGSLRRFKDDVKEVNQGMECGISFENIINVKVDDEIECYLTEKIKKKLVIEE